MLFVVLYPSSLGSCFPALVNMEPEQCNSPEHPSVSLTLIGDMQPALLLALCTLASLGSGPCTSSLGFSVHGTQSIFGVLVYLKSRCGVFLNLIGDMQPAISLYALVSLGSRPGVMLGVFSGWLLAHTLPLDDLFLPIFIFISLMTRCVPDPLQ